MPIKNNRGVLEGVIQAINKLGGSDMEDKMSKISFSKEDEGILEMLGQIAGLFLKSTIKFSEQINHNDSLKRVIEYGIDLLKSNTVEELIEKSS